MFDCVVAQVHVDADGRSRVFSRAGEDSSGRFAAIGRTIARRRRPGVGAVIVEGEVVAVDRSSGAILPFQHLTARAR